MKISIVLAAMTGSFETDMNRASKTAQKRMKELEKTAKQVGAAVGAAFVIAAGAVAVGTKRAIDRMDEIAKSAQKVGVTTEAFSKLAFAADLAGVEATALEGAMAKLARSQDDAARGTKETLDIFRALGVEFQNADGTLRKSDEVLADIADRFKALPDGANKTAAAMGLLGRSGAQLIPLLNGGNAGLKEAGDQLERLGGVVTPEAARQAEQFNDDLNRLSVAIDGVWMGVASRLLPDLIELTGAFVTGAEEGGEFASVADDISAAIATVAETAYRAYKQVELLTNGLVEMGARAVNAVASNPFSGVGFVDQAFFGGSLARESGILAESSAIRASEAAAAADFGLGLGSNATDSPQRRATQEQTEAEKQLAAALDERRTAQARASAAAKADAEAKKAAAEAAKRQKEEEEAALKLAEKVFEQRMELVNAAALERKEREQALAQGKQLRDDLKFELKLMEMTNAERATAIQLRGLDAEAVRKYGAEIAALNEKIERQIEVIGAMDMARNEVSGLFEDLINGTKSAKDAFMDFVDSMLANIARMVADGLTQQLMGQFGTNQTGAAGGGWASLLGSLFGGPRAEGGPVYPGQAYLVGEEGPELVMPKSAGTVVPAGQTAAMLGGRGAQITQQFLMPGRYELRTQAQVAATAGRASQRAIARSTA